MMLEGKRLVVTGVLTDASIAYSVARMAQEQGAEIVLTSFGRARRITERVDRNVAASPAVHARLGSIAKIVGHDVEHFHPPRQPLLGGWGCSRR